MKKLVDRFLPYFVLPIISLIVFLVTLNTEGLFTLDELGIFLTVVGLIYGLLIAFAISNVWERFGTLKTNIGEETSAFKNIYLMSRALSNPKIKDLFAERIREYCNEVISTDFSDYPKKNTLHRKFRTIFSTIENIELKNTKDIELFTNLVDALRNASKSRIHQLVAIQTPISISRWILIYSLSAILIMGFLFIEGINNLLGSLIATAVTIIVLLLIFLIRELNDLSFEFEGVTIEPYKKVLRVIDSEE